MINSPVQISEVIQRTMDVKSFRFGVGNDISYKAGQWFFVTITVDGEEMTKPFTISSSPTEKGYVEFTKRITSSAFSQTLEKMRPGDEAHIKMPYGQFTFEGEHDKVAFLSGGIGITPFRSICRYATDMKLESDIILLYGNATEENIIFRDAFDQMQKENKRLKVIHTLTSPGASCSEWKGCTGFVDRCMIEREIPEHEERVFYICGPPGMVTYLKDVLTGEMKKPESGVVVERFAGY